MSELTRRQILVKTLGAQITVQWQYVEAGGLPASISQEDIPIVAGQWCIDQLLDSVVIIDRLAFQSLIASFKIALNSLEIVETEVNNRALVNSANKLRSLISSIEETEKWTSSRE